jgi:NAD(P)-dependent dehydrogenase (short-subunit alcohol dehydrogenase family)
MSHHINELFSLKDKVAIVTGGAGYLGNAMCEALAEAGANVVIADIVDATDKAAQMSENNPEAFAVQVDNSDKVSVQNMIDETLKKFGRLDILINCGGKTSLCPLEDMELELWDQCLKSYLTSVFLCSQAAYKVMRENGGGNIINIASMYGVIAPDQRIYGDSGHNNPGHYGAAKGGVVQFTRYCATYMAKDNIRVNAISPGTFPHVNTQENDDLVQQLAMKNPMERIGKPWELKGAALFLASDASSYITGQNILVDGGWTTW